MAIQLSRLPYDIVGIAGALQLLCTRTNVALVIMGQNGDGDWVTTGQKVEPDHPRSGWRDIMTVAVQNELAEQWRRAEGQDPSPSWYSNHDTSQESLDTLHRLIMHWQTVEQRYRQTPGILEEWADVL